MDKPYLLLAGEQHYPQSYTGDWRGFYVSEEEALKALAELEDEGHNFDWHEVVNILVESA